ncbi:MAG: response regulator transcription factor, partial [Planctomycetes bacterium]|nr:response regulator transcription factor [Planctomycetota bacterium]
MIAKVLLVDDHKIVLQGLRTLLAAAGDMEVIGEVTNGRDAVEKACLLRPDVVIMDVAMPGLNGIEATRELCRLLAGVKVVALSMHTAGRFVAEMLDAGASAY